MTWKGIPDSKKRLKSWLLEKFNHKTDFILGYLRQWSYSLFVRDVISPCSLGCINNRPLEKPLASGWTHASGNASAITSSRYNSLPTSGPHILTCHGRTVEGSFGQCSRTNRTPTTTVDLLNLLPHCLHSQPYSIRHSNIALLQNYGANAWRIQNHLLENTAKNLEKALDELKELTTEVNRDRKNSQVRFHFDLNVYFISYHSPTP